MTYSGPGRPPASSGRSRPPRAIVVGLLVGIVAVLVIASVAAIVKGTSAKPVTVGDAVNQFRQDTHHTPQPHAPATPSPTASPSGSPRPHHHATASPAAAATNTAAPHATVSTQTSPAPGTTSSATSRPRHSHHPSGGSTPPPLSTPSAGVYRYATTGSERASVPGAHRNFPKTTTITLEHHGCGASLTWRANSEHTETQELCPRGNALYLASYQTRIGFYGVDNTEDYTCDHDAYVYSTTLRPGQTWAFSCRSSDATVAQQLTAVGFETLQVGSRSVRTMHVHIATTLSGSNSGTSTQDVWIGTSTTYLVRNTGSVDATQGGVHYQSHFRLDLDSLTPRR